MAKFGKKAKLTLGLAALLALSGCESKEKKAEREAAAEKERAAAVERERAEAQRQEDNLTTVIYDSLMNVPNTVDDLSAKQAGIYCDDFRNNRGIGTKHELDSLKNVSMKTVLCDRIAKSADQIITQHIKNMYASLATYNLGVNVDARIDEYKSNWGINIYGSEASDTVYDANMYDFEWRQEEFVEIMLKGADTSMYGAGRRQEIVNVVKKTYVDMQRALKQNRIAVAKEFADYYPVLDINRVPKQYRKYFANYDPAVQPGGEGTTFYGFEYLPTDFAIVKRVNVYDSKLKPEFFNVPDAKYQLVKVSKGKWKVIRTLKSGKKAETPVFTHNVDYTTDLQCWMGLEGVKSGDCSFFAEAGSNLGVHISVTEYEYVAHAVKSDKLPDPKGERAARIAQLEQKQVEIDSLQSQYWDYSKRAYQRASEMAVKRLGRNR